MNKIKDDFTTPKQTKRLGLRRKNSALKQPDSISANKTTGSITKTHTPRLPQSDVRIDYRNLERSEGSSRNNEEINTPGTPKTSVSLEEKRQAVSTNCRPYRLSLSKRVREKMTKKKLEFHLANEMEKEENLEKHENESRLRGDKEIDSNVETTSKEDGKANEIKQIACHEEENACERLIITKDNYKNEELKDSTEIPNELSRDELLAKIETLRNDLKARQEYALKVQELKDTINKWKLGFSAAFNDLQQKVEPRLDTETLLEQLHIPQEMLKYIND